MSSYQTREVAKNYKMFANPVLITPGRCINEVVPSHVLVLGICLLLSIFVKREFTVQFLI